MDNILNKVTTAVHQFGEEEDGAQVVEYALIIAMVSIALAIALSAFDLEVTTLASRVRACLAKGATDC